MDDDWPIDNQRQTGQSLASTLVTGGFLLIMAMFLDERITKIPLAALMAVMIMVST